MSSALSALTKFADLKRELGSIKVADVTPDDAVAGLSLLGFSDRSTIENFLTAAKRVASGSEETVMDFVMNGGLARLFASKQAKSSLIVQCTHCHELNFIS